MEECKIFNNDEIIMVGLKMMNEININLQMAKESDLPFGCLTVLFSGDFAQMAPVREKPLYHRTDVESGSINSLNLTSYRS